MARILFTPTTLGDIKVKNRIAMAPLTRGRAGASRIPNALIAEYYTQRAEAGLIITEATSISVQGLGWVGSPGIYEDAHTQGWKTVVDAVHAKGGKIVLQLWHCGRASHTSFHPELGLPVAPSAIAIQGDSIHTPNGKQAYEVPRALELSELPAIVTDYQNAARRAMSAGFDGVEIHSANGYLLNQFLDDHSNHRTDAYGGSIENRSRLLREVVEAITEVMPTNRVGVRVAPNGMFNDMGDSNPRALYLAVAEQLNQYGLAYLHVMDGLGFGSRDDITPMALSDFRQVFTGSMMGNVGYTQDRAETVIAQGDADIIAFGRPFITNPDLVQRFTHHWQLADFNDPASWYGDNASGYTDYPAYQLEAVKV